MSFLPNHNRKRKHRSIISLVERTKHVDADDWYHLVAYFQACWDRHYHRQNGNGKDNDNYKARLSREQLDDLARSIEVMGRPTASSTSTITDNDGGRIVSVRTPSSLLVPPHEADDNIDDDDFVDESQPQEQERQRRPNEVEVDGRDDEVWDDGDDDGTQRAAAAPAAAAAVSPSSSLPSLGGLDCLRRLHLGGHQHHPTLPPGIGNLPQLEELILTYPHLTDLPDDVFGGTDDGRVNVSKLTFLDLSGCTSLRRLPSNLGTIVGPTLQVLAINLGRLETIPESLAKLTNLHTLYYVGNNGNQSHNHYGNHHNLDQYSSNSHSNPPRTDETTDGTATKLSSILSHWTDLRRLYIGMNDLLETLPTSVLPKRNGIIAMAHDNTNNNNDNDDDDDILRYGGWHRLEEIYITMDVSRTLWDLREEQHRQEDQEDGNTNNNNNNWNQFVEASRNGGNDGGDGDSDSEEERPYNPCNTILVNALTGRIVRWTALRKIHFDFLWMYGPFLPVPTANDRVTVPLTLLHPLADTLQELSIFCGPSNGDGTPLHAMPSASGFSSISGSATPVAPAMSTSTTNTSTTTTTSNMQSQSPPPVPLVELVLQDIGNLVHLRSLSLSHCKLVAPPPPPSPLTMTMIAHDMHKDDDAATIPTGVGWHEETLHGGGGTLGTNPKPRLTEFRLQCCFQFFTSSRACDFVATHLDLSELRYFQLSQCHEALGDYEFHRLCTTVLKQCPQLVEVDLSDGNIFQLDIGDSEGPNGLDGDSNLLLSCLPPTLKVLELSRNPALCPSEHSVPRGVGGCPMTVNRRNTQTLWYLIARFPFLGFLGRFNILFLGRLGENYERLEEYYGLVHHLALNRARYRVLSGTLHATDLPVALWPHILERSQRAYDDYPNYVLARNRKDEADAIYHLLRERGAEDIFPLPKALDAPAGGGI